MSVTDTLPRGRAGLSMPLWAGLAGLAAIPAASFVAGAAALNLAFLAAAAGLGVIWMDKAPRKFILLAAFLVIFTPLVRRVIDFNTGYSASNPVMLAPYLVPCLAAPYALAAALGGRRYSAELFLLTAAVLWGMVLGFHYSSPVDVVLATLRWLTPLMLLGYLMCKSSPALLGETVPGLLVLGVIASIYGVVQFVSPLPWDVYWVENTPIGSGPLGILGTPEPFSLRVFGSSNSPGSLATALIFIVTIALSQRATVVALPVALAVFLAVPLTLQRSVIGAFAVTLLLLLVLGARPLRARLLGILAGVTALAAVGVSLGLASGAVGVERLTDRFAVSSNLAEDESLQARLRQVENFADWVEPYLVAGYGFDWKDRIEAPPTSQNLQSPVFVMDNGIFDTFLSLGAIAGTVFLVALASLALAALRGGLRQDWTALGAACAGAGLLAQLPLGTVQAGELGFFAFLGLGFGLQRRTIPAGAERA